MTENIVTGKHYRILTDSTNKIWSRVSFWKKGVDVNNNKGTDLQTAVGEITGITDSLTSTSSTVVASAKAIKALNDKIVALEEEYG
jgi:hypothetical protein